MTENTRSVYVAQPLRGKWVPEGLASAIEAALQTETGVLRHLYNAIPLTEAPDLELEKLHEAVIGAAATVDAGSFMENCHDQLLALHEACKALRLYLAKTAKPKREEGKWYVGQTKTSKTPRPWWFFNGRFGRDDEEGGRLKETDFDWISDTPLDLKHSSEECRNPSGS